MADLIHETRNGSPTYGKPRVYLSFCIEDEELYALPLCQDILSAENCAVFYYQDGVMPDKETEISAQLEPMQLFILVCTECYLSYDTVRRAMLFAENHGIPILPVILESSALNEFNTLCEKMRIGSLHALNKCKYADNEAGYLGKLKEYLDYFLISDEDTENIRRHFKACIFLGYRKMDAQAAKKLISRIHHLEQYYDVAVWYDDYLVPGKPFEKEIFEAMDRSDIFILAVTQNVTKLNAENKENYVVSKEYPEALNRLRKKRIKKIVAAELENIDRAALMLKFEDIPDCIDGFDDLLLSQTLSPLDDMPCQNGSEHDYYIGLAYLNGIDTEVDHETAFRLISSAAEAGFEEAMDRLVRMYRSGIAVKRDYEEAISWQDKLIARAQRRFEEEENEENLHELMFRLDALGNYRNENGDVLDATVCYEKIVRLGEKYIDQYPTTVLLRDVSVACNKIGVIAMNRLDPDTALRYCTTGYRAAKSICDAAPDNDLFYADYGVSLERLGQAYFLMENYSLAKEYYSQAHEIALKTAKEKPTAANRRSLSVLSVKLGDVMFAKGEYQDAEALFKKELEHRENLDNELDADWTKRDLSLINERLGDLYYAQRKNDQAREMFEHAIQIADELADRTGMSVHAQELSKLCTKLGEFYLIIGDYDEAMYYLDNALEIDKNAVKEHYSIDNLRDLSVSYNRLGMTFKEMGDDERAKEYFFRDYNIAKELMDRVDSVDSRRDYGLSCTYMGNECARFGEMEEALWYFEKGVSILKPLSEKTNDPVHLDDLAVLYYNMFRSFRDRARELKEADRIWGELIRRCPDNETYRQRYELTQKLIRYSV